MKIIVNYFFLDQRDINTMLRNPLRTSGEFFYWPLLVVITFLFIYSFRLIGSINSGILIVLISPFMLILHKNAISIFFYIIRNKIFIVALTLHVSAVVIALFFPVLKGTYDFSFARPLINNMASVVAAAALVSLFYATCRTKDISDLIIYTLLLQCLIIYLMMLLPELREIIQSHTMSDQLRDRMATYGGIRGLGLSGSTAFGLAVIMGMQGLILHYWLATRAHKFSAYLKVLIFLFAFFASISAGRTAVLGFAIGFILYFLIYVRRDLIIKIAKYIIIVLSLLGLSIAFILSNSHLEEIAFRFSRYAFQFYWSWLDGRGFEITSLQGLQRMYFLPPNGNWFFGDGYYTSSSGGYYMSTDAGYMRFLLFFGFVGSLIFYLLFLFIGFISFLKLKSFRMAGVVVLLMVIMAFVFHYKGDVVLYSVGFMKIFYLFVFFYLIKRRYCNEKSFVN